MGQIKWAHSARRDLHEIVQFITQDSKANAESFAERLHDKIARLKDFPYSGPVIPEEPESSYRHLLFGNYRVVYMVEEDTTYILRVVHGARDMGQEFKDS